MFSQHKTIMSYLRRFRDDEGGSMSIELLLVVPILVWVFLATFVYFDVFRVETNTVRATITLAEMLSREDLVDQNYVDNAEAVLRALTYEESSPDVRITVYRYRKSDNTYQRVWSTTSDASDIGPKLTNADLLDLQAKGRFPPMAELDHNIYIETQTKYDAPFNIGIGPFAVTNLEDITFTNDMIIRPRAGRLCWDPTPGSNGDEVCD